MITRRFWLENLIKNNEYKIGVELGVLRGPTFVHLVKSCPGYKHVGVDVFSDDKIWRKQKGITTSEELLKEPIVPWYGPLKEFADKNGAVLIRDLTVEAAKQFDDKSIDYVFIDAGHHYEAVAADIKAWAPKVRPGGTIAGHDIDLPDVVKAVEEVYNKMYAVGPDNIWYIRKHK